MNNFEQLLARQTVASPLPFALDSRRCHRLDLAGASGFDPGNTAAFTAHIWQKMAAEGAAYAAGGYGENRKLYGMSEVFAAGRNGDEPRTLHLGIDLWLDAGTPVHAVLPGVVHSTQENPAFGDYGPTLILEHEAEGCRFFTLYGHLSRPTLQLTKVGAHVESGQLLGWLGDAAVNVGWPPHLHFQIIRDLGGRSGDYPGVCRPSEAAQWLAGSPDPNLLLRIAALS